MNAKGILKAIGLGAAGAGAVVANAATGGASAPLTDKILDLVSSKITDPNLKAQLDSAASQAQDDLTKAELDHTEKIIAAVNATMQAELQDKNWFGRDWRPLFGYVAGLMLFNNFILLTYLRRFGLEPVVIPPDVIAMILAVLGITAYHQGQTDLTNARNGGTR